MTSQCLYSPLNGDTKSWRQEKYWDDFKTSGKIHLPDWYLCRLSMIMVNKLIPHGEGGGEGVGEAAGGLMILNKLNRFFYHRHEEDEFFLLVCAHVLFCIKKFN